MPLIKIPTNILISSSHYQVIFPVPRNVIGPKVVSKPRQEAGPDLRARVINDRQYGRRDNSVSDIGSIKDVDLPLLIETTYILSPRAYDQVWNTIVIEVRGTYLAKLGVRLWK